MNAQEFQDDKEVSAIWVKSPGSIVNKMNNTKSCMFDMKPKNAIKPDFAKLDKSETYPEENVLPEDSLCRYPYRSDKQREVQKAGLKTKILYLE